jgi:hypothetical protein
MHMNSKLLLQNRSDCADYMLDLIFMLLDTAHEFSWTGCAAALDQAALQLMRESDLSSRNANHISVSSELVISHDDYMQK